MAEIAAKTRTNRRLTARRTCHLAVKYNIKGAWHPAIVMDVSATGCRLRLGEELPRGVAVPVRFECPPNLENAPPEVEVSAQVIWTRLEGLSFQVGLHFASSPLGLHEIITVLA